MTITITTKGKYTALEAEAIPPLVELVDDECSEVRINAIKVKDNVKDGANKVHSLPLLDSQLASPITIHHMGLFVPNNTNDSHDILDLQLNNL